MHTPTPDEIRALRTALDLSRHEFASKLEVSYQTVGNWERGDNTPRDHYVHRLNELAAANDVPADVYPSVPVSADTTTSASPATVSATIAGDGVGDGDGTGAGDGNMAPSAGGTGGTASDWSPAQDSARLAEQVSAVLPDLWYATVVLRAGTDDNRLELDVQDATVFAMAMAWDADEAVHSWLTRQDRVDADFGAANVTFRGMTASAHADLTAFLLLDEILDELPSEVVTAIREQYFRPGLPIAEVEFFGSRGYDVTLLVDLEG